MPSPLRRTIGLACCLCLLVLARPESATPDGGPRFSITIPPGRSAQPLDGRLLLLLSNDPSAEPRMQISVSPGTQMVFGVDVDALAPGQSVTIDDRLLWLSRPQPARRSRGDYFVQVVLHRYETFHRADGHTVKLPMDRGEGQHWNIAPGNLYRMPRKFRSAYRRRPYNLSRPGNPADPAEGHEIHQSYQNSERNFSPILGTSDLSQRERSRPRRLRRSSQRPIRWCFHRITSTRTSTAFAPSLRIQFSSPTTASAFTSPATTAFSRKKLTSFISIGPARISAGSDRGNQSRESLLRRFLRGELRQPRPLWRRDRDGSDPRD